MSKDKDTLAFPQAGFTDARGDFNFPLAGMSLRDYYAGKALQGMISSAQIVDRSTVEKGRWAVVAYEFADAMMHERAK